MSEPMPTSSFRRLISADDGFEIVALPDGLRASVAGSEPSLRRRPRWARRRQDLLRSKRCGGTGGAHPRVQRGSPDGAPQVASLEGRFRVIRFDQREHGQSASPTARYSRHGDLRWVLDALGVGGRRLSGCPRGPRSRSTSRWCIRRCPLLVLASPGLRGYMPSTPMTWAQPVFKAAVAGAPKGRRGYGWQRR